MMLFLDEEQVRKHLRMADLIPAMEKALIDFSTGKVTQPVRQVIPVDPPGGFYGMMPALTPEGLGQKIVTFYPPNAERGIPTHMATILLNDPQTGAPLAVMDGRLITEMRTAAVSAAATKLLAPKDAKILAILGSGVQARSHAEALQLVRQFEEIRVWSPNKLHAEQFAKKKIPFIFDPGQGLPMFDGDDLRHFIDLATWVTVNDYEWELLKDRTGWTETDIVSRVDALIVTLGGNGSVIHTKQKKHEIPSVKPKSVQDPTGCGDAYRAGLLYGLLNDLDWQTTGRIASLMGSIKIEHQGPQNHKFTLSQFKKRYKAAFGHSL